MVDKVILLAKLANNMDVIGELVPTPEGEVADARTLLFKRLRAFQYVVQGNQISINFQAFLIPAEDEDLPLAKAHIITMLPAPAKIMEAYLTAVSPIQLAKSIPTGSPGGKLIDIIKGNGH